MGRDRGKRAGGVGFLGRGRRKKKKKRGRRGVGPGWIGLEEKEMFYLFGRRF